MSSNIRQSELFAGQDWTVIYKSFSEVNLNAYDFDTIRQSMKEYIQRNYPEDFNDWIESSEFVMLIDLLAYLGQSLAFRMDIDARENFLEIARSRENILRLARFLSYSPKRNLPSKGLVKLSEITTTQEIYDSAGNNLSSRTIRWDDPNNPNWFEQFILVMNASLISTNQFGTPLKIANISGVSTQLYRLENIPFTTGNVPFSATINNATYAFDIVNIDFSTQEGFFERNPDPNAAFHILYRNDGNGNQSPNTGFFLMFKQGALLRTDVVFAEPLENRVLDIDVINLNESDIWVQSILESGAVEKDWTRVGYVPDDDIRKIIITGENVSYNDVPINVRDIYQVVTRDQDRISVRFGDGRFGSIPTGLVRVWHRQSAGVNMTIRPEDMRNVGITLPYQSSNGRRHTLGISFSLQETISNSVVTESNDDIRRRASGVYATQGRMVSGDDYNQFPASNQIALKVKAINRVYSGHSRYIDLNDPTGTYQNTIVFSDDGCIYREFENTYSEVAMNNNYSNEFIVSNYIVPALAGTSLRDFLFNEWLTKVNNPGYDFEFTGEAVRWERSTNSIYSSTGRLARTDVIPTTEQEWNDAAIELGGYAPDDAVERHILPLSLIKFRDAGWTTVNSIDGTGISFLTNGRGPVRLNESVNTGDIALQLIPSYRRELNVDERNQLLSRLAAKRTFGMGWDIDKQEWYFMDSSHINLGGDYDYITKDTSADSSWLIKCEYSTLNWRFTTRGLKYVFESMNDVKFFFTNEYKAIDPQTGKVGTDSITVLDSNYNPLIASASVWNKNTAYKVGDIVSVESVVNNIKQVNYWECVLNHTSTTEFVPYRATINTQVEPPAAVLIETWRSVAPGLGKDVNWTVNANYTYNDGFQEPRRVKITFNDSDLDGQPDNPEAFDEIVNKGKWVFHKRVLDIYGYSSYVITDDVLAVKQGSALPVMKPGQIVFLYNEAMTTGTFYRYLRNSEGVPTLGKVSEFAPINDQSEYTYDRGRDHLKFQWTHYAPLDQRIDPAINNIIDIFVLTREYNNLMRQWYDAGANILTKPSPTSELQLRTTFSGLEEYKMFTDQIAWRPVKYKLIFGNSADLELRAKFKIVKLANTTVSDGEIKSRILDAIQDFFDVNNWDFGETFYYTELSAYVHRQLVNAIASIVIVPLKETQSFGELFEVRCNPDELFFPTATVDDIEIIPSNTHLSLRIK